MSKVAGRWREAWESRPHVLKFGRSNRQSLRDALVSTEVDPTKSSAPAARHVEQLRPQDNPGERVPNEVAHSVEQIASQPEDSSPAATPISNPSPLSPREDRHDPAPAEEGRLTSLFHVEGVPESSPPPIRASSDQLAPDRVVGDGHTSRSAMSYSSPHNDQTERQDASEPPALSEVVPAIYVARSDTLPQEGMDSRPRPGPRSQLRLQIPSWSRQPTSGSFPKSPAPSISEGKMMQEMLPLLIRVDVIMDWDGDINIHEKEFPEFNWILADNYKELLPDKILEKHQEAYKDLQKKYIYHRHGSCRVKAPAGLNYDAEYAILDDAKADVLSQKARQQICGFIYKYPFQEFSLEVYWDSCAAQLELPGENDEGYSARTKYRDLIRSEMDGKMRENFRQKSYISFRDLTVFGKYDVVRKLIFSDSSLRDAECSDAMKESLVSKVHQLPAVDLLMICLHKGFDLTTWEHLINHHQWTDKAPPAKHMGCQGTCQGWITAILKARPAFSARKVRPDYQHHQLDDDIMPLLLTGDQQNRKEVLGTGVSSHVFKVKIDSAHHYLSGDPRCEFALKQFDSHRSDAFKREIAMLRILANYPDDHIVLHLTSWTQDDTHYILYPLAAYNLRTFMLKRGQPRLRRSVVLWFLRQLEGLAKAIHHVHNLTFPSRTNPHPDTESLQGYHHDIKPENILVFENEPTAHPSFKISDFGVGMFSQPNPRGVSRFTGEANGTLTYFAPDKDRPPHHVSRPFDMWALGCVYLELMRWLFDLARSETGEGFITQRLEHGKATAEVVRDDMFWARTSGPAGDEYDLKLPVKEALDDLEHEICVDMRAFLNVIIAIRGLLAIDPEKRWTAKKLMPFLTRIVRQTETDLEHEPWFYQAKYDENCGRSPTSQKLQSERLDPNVSVAGESTRPPSVAEYSLDSPEESGRARPRGDTGASDVVPFVGLGTDPAAPTSNGATNYDQMAAESTEDALDDELQSIPGSG